MLLRLLSVLLLGLVLGQTLAAAPLPGSDACEQCCPGESSDDGECPPDCDECACCPSVRCVLAPPVLMPGDAGDALDPVADGTVALPTVDPREILHVPIALL